MSTEYFRHENMIPAPAASAAVDVQWKTEDGITLCRGTTAYNAAPLTTAGLYAPGCIYVQVVDSTSKAYLNTGTLASPSWTLFGSVS